MILLIDIGNTRIKLAWVKNQQIISTEFLTHDANLEECLKATLRPVDYAIGINVSKNTLQNTIDQTLSPYCKVYWLSTPEQTGEVKNGYQITARLGVDRWYGLVGLHAQIPQAIPRILVNFGTATTIDTLNPEHTFIGGLIVPGIDMMLHSLHQGTAQLPLANGNYTAFPTVTDSAITSGVMNAQLGAIQRQIVHCYHHFNAKPRVFVTGGAWKFMQSLIIDTPIELETCKLEYTEHPIFDGLIYKARLGLIH